MQEYRVELKLPKSRIAVLIGPKGSVKKQIEEGTKIQLEVDSTEGDVILKSTDSIRLYMGKEIVRAIGRGFSPPKAMQLLNPDYNLDILLLRNYSNTKNAMIRIKSRVIGAKGKARHTIEELTETDISIFGKTVGIIGKPENIALARHAVQDLLKGSTHRSVFTWLERQRRGLKLRKIFNKDVGLVKSDFLSEETE